MCNVLLKAILLHMFFSFAVCAAAERAVSLDVRRAKEELQPAKDPSLSQVADWSLLKELKLERSKIPYWLKNDEP
jgi:hypothetical protein